MAPQLVLRSLAFLTRPRRVVRTNLQALTSQGHTHVAHLFYRGDAHTLPAKSLADELGVDHSPADYGTLGREMLITNLKLISHKVSTQP